MKAWDKIEAAFSPEGTPEIPAVICYESIFVRDHWSAITDKPWWYQHSPDMEHHMAWLRDVIGRTGLDWYMLPTFYSREDRKHISVSVTPEGVFLSDSRTGNRELLHEPRVSGWSVSGGIESVRPETPAQTPEEIDRLIPIEEDYNVGDIVANGRKDLAGRFLGEFDGAVYPYRRVDSPLWRCYHLWGFEDMMVMIAEHPELIRYAGSRYLELSIRAVHEASVLGAAGIFIEECLTDMISPAAFRALNLPFVRRLTEEIRSLGMRSIYYFCGNPAGKWEYLLDSGADALSFEEGKKGFEIDIGNVIDRVRGRCAVLGNLDAINLLPNASEDNLRAEIRRQISAGRRNGSRFIMSIGSPVTPETSVEQVRRYCDMVHEIKT
ncbi:uroporphyrinogen decarboxylase family protein [bacterium]|nr:uroporphyrinogen decarboxylase family protein [bacterium]